MLWIHAILLYQIFHRVNMVAQVLTAHVTVSPRAPVAAVTCAGGVIDVHDIIAVISQHVIEHVFPEIMLAPRIGNVLQVTSAMHKYDGRFCRVGILWFVYPRVNI